MRIIYCRECKEPIALRSRGLKDAFTHEADRLRREYRGKLKVFTSESSDKQLCAECLEKKGKDSQ